MESSREFNSLLKLANILKKYLQITKPVIVVSNLISMIGGFFLASKSNINYVLFFFTLSSVTLIIASSCVYNNYIDRDIDKKMERTRNRVLARDLVSPFASLLYATSLGIIGFILLLIGTNLLSFWLGLLGFIVYVGIYSLYMKRHSVYSTLIGSISGAIPPIIGYCAVTNKFDIGAFILLSIFSLWQIPHSYATIIFFLKDYQIANIPVLPIKKGILVAKRHILIYIVAFSIAAIMLFLKGYVGYKYLFITTMLSILWFNIAVSNYKTTNNISIWARRLFVFSIIIITSISILMSIDFIKLN